MVGPILDFQLDLQKKHELIDALQELKMQEEDVTFLEAEYADTLANAGLIKVRYRHHCHHRYRHHCHHRRACASVCLSVCLPVCVLTACVCCVIVIVIVQAEIKHQPQRLERLHQLVVDHWVEYARFKGKALGTTVTNLQQVRKLTAHFLSAFLNTKMIILPRQARDKHGESTQTRVPFSCRSCGSTSMGLKGWSASLRSQCSRRQLYH